MYIKISPKEALNQIDSIIKEGYLLRNSIYDDYENVEKKAEEAEDLAEKEKEKELEDLESNAPESAFAAFDQFNKKMKLLADDVRPRFLLNEEKVSTEVIDGYLKKYSDWNNTALGLLQEIFQHFAPIYKFKTSLTFTKFKEPFLNHNYKEFVMVLDRLDSNLNTLVSFYDELKDSVKSPLIYFPDRAQIWFYDFVCHLEPDSNEAALCDFMFKFAVGEFKEFMDIYEHIVGKVDGSLSKGWEKIVNSSFDGVNRKTNVRFGFPVFKKQKLTLSLNFPSRLVSALV